jgi:hypothetical protein
VISRRILEIATAALTAAFGIAIVVASFNAGVGWTARGVASGTFPALAGGLIVAGSGYNAARAFAREAEWVLEGPGILKLLLLFVPAALFVAAIPLLGLHAAAGLYIFGVIAAHPRGSWPKAAIFGVATPLALYFTFDWAFSVTLPRGLLGAALGL